MDERNGGELVAPQKAYPYQLCEVAPGVWPLPLGWSCAYVLTDGGEFSLVDNGTRDDRRLLLAGLAAIGLEVRHCRQILQTHAHCDHAGNAAYIADRTGALLHTHVDEVPFMQTSRTYVPRGLRALSINGLIFAGAEFIYPVRRHRVDVVLQDNDVVETPAGPWRALHTPGHTPGHISFYREQDDTLISGDALLTIIPVRRVAGLSLPPWFFNSDTWQARRSLQRIFELRPSSLLPGHGRPMVEDTPARIEEYARKIT